MMAGRLAQDVMLINKNMQSGRLSFSTDTDRCIETSDVIFICVNTPPKANGEADLKYVEEAARQIAKQDRHGVTRWIGHGYVRDAVVVELTDGYRCRTIPHADDRRERKPTLAVA